MKTRKLSESDYIGLQPDSSLERAWRNRANHGEGLSRDTRVLGGKDSSHGKFPHMISLQTHKLIGSSFCGGALIADSWVLSAAHCFTDISSEEIEQTCGRNGCRYYEPKDFEAVAGAFKIEINEVEQQRRQLAEWHIHPFYTARPVSHDIVLLKTKEPFKFTDFISPACLPKPEEILEPNQICFISGWGYMGVEDNIELIEKLPDLLQEASSFTYNSCKERYGRNFVPGKNICIGGRGIVARDGDSGGPLTCIRLSKRRDELYYTLYGLSSFSAAKLTARLPSVYTKVSMYVEWIDNKIKESKHSDVQGSNFDEFLPTTLYDNEQDDADKIAPRALLPNPSQFQNSTVSDSESSGQIVSDSEESIREVAPRAELPSPIQQAILPETVDTGPIVNVSSVMAIAEVAPRASQPNPYHNFRSLSDQFFQTRPQIMESQTHVESQGPEECLEDPLGLSYNGTESVAKKRTCVPWVRLSSRNRFRTLPSNFCRNPDRDARGPWCYVYLPQRRNSKPIYRVRCILKVSVDFASASLKNADFTTQVERTRQKMAINASLGALSLGIILTETMRRITAEIRIKIQMGRGATLERMCWGIWYSSIATFQNARGGQVDELKK
ncbi:unnamed protein product [Oikopleura dioica]|uniref:Peptidase S1 domain-containing protein n=1 Tax=Oikopleura dioica TaxID=34765 RepID=E4YQQ2_OIKDI|nr:unnamed protein product [Oikopleura dioica]